MRLGPRTEEPVDPGSCVPQRLLISDEGSFIEPDAIPICRPPQEVSVVVLTHEVTGGGRGKSSVDLSCALAQLGYRVTCLAHPRRGVPEQCRADLAEARAALQLLPPSPLRSPLTLARVMGTLKSLRPDVILCHSSELLAWLACVKRHCGNPRLVFIKRGLHARGGIWRALLDWRSAQVDAVVCVSRVVANCWMLTRPHRCSCPTYVVHCGVRVPRRDAMPGKAALRRELALPPNAAVVGVLGRMDWQKGHQYVIHALPLILKRRPEVYLVVVGDGPYLRVLKRLATDVGIAERVKFLGWREDILTPLAAMDVFCHATLLEIMSRSTYVSRWRRIPLTPSLAGEPLGRAVLEASAAGVPVVATDAGGHREIIEHGKTGLLVELADAPALAAAVLQVLAHPEKSEAMGEAARERITRHFSLGVMGQRFHYVIQETLSRSPGARVGT